MFNYILYIENIYFKNPVLYLWVCKLHNLICMKTNNILICAIIIVFKNE